MINRYIFTGGDNRVHYITVDFEWNQPLEGAQRINLGEDEFLCGEIIQIGAVKTDGNFRKISEFSAFVRPVKYVKMNRRVESITGITSEMTRSCDTFPTVCERFREWCGDGAMFITWGFDDIRVLRQNCEMHSLDCSWFSEWINLQVVYGMQTKDEPSQKSLIGAMEHFGIVPNDSLPMHNALSDAYYTYIICTLLDTKKGIADYPHSGKYDRFRPKNRFGKSLKTVHSGFDTKKAAFLSSEVSVCPCPICGEALTDIRWIRKHSLHYRSRGVCAAHGEYTVRLSFRREGGAWSVTKVIFHPVSSDEKNGER